VSLDSSTVYKCLEKKTLILGFEVIDLFVMSVLLCLLNFIFAESSLKLFFTFGPVGILALILRVMKMGKAENYLLHWLRFQFTPGVFRAWPLCGDQNAFLKMKQKGVFKYAGFKSRKSS
jgi:hypothetical protein